MPLLGGFVQVEDDATVELLISLAKAQQSAASSAPA
jgi:hypothetical protein